MKKVKSLEDLASLMTKLGATKETEPGFTSWTLHCGPDRQKRQAASFLSQCGISYDHKAKNFKMKKQKATSSQAPKRVGPPNKVKGSKLQG